MDLNRQWNSKIPTGWQLAFLPITSAAGQAYLREMHYCVEFALANRRIMVEKVKEALLSVVQPVFFEPIINIAHNYADMEVHFDKQVLVHRKGATRAQAGEIGIIPGSQGSPSYIVKGKGNADSFESCSHGAGRKMGRKQAQRQLDLTQEKKRLDDQGIIHAVRSTGDLDEATGAYKDIDEVIDNQLDLVEVVVALRPLAVIKG
jgi:tRNA-splicing ligase RtcB